MKHLLLPTFAVTVSTAGTAYGCHLAGMPVHDVEIATLLAACVSSIAAYGAVLLASRRRPITTPANVAQPR